MRKLKVVWLNSCSFLEKLQPVGPTCYLTPPVHLASLFFSWLLSHAPPRLLLKRAGGGGAHAPGRPPSPSCPPARRRQQSSRSRPRTLLYTSSPAPTAAELTLPTAAPLSPPPVHRRVGAEVETVTAGLGEEVETR